MERQTLDPTYASFLIKFGGKDVRVIDSIAPMRRGMHAGRIIEVANTRTKHNRRQAQQSHVPGVGTRAEHSRRHGMPVRTTPQCHMRCYSSWLGLHFGNRFIMRPMHAQSNLVCYSTSLDLHTKDSGEPFRCMPLCIRSRRQSCFSSSCEALSSQEDFISHWEATLWSNVRLLTLQMERISPTTTRDRFFFPMTSPCARLLSHTVLQRNKLVNTLLLSANAASQSGDSWPATR